MKRRRAIGKAIRTQAEAYLADGTVTTEPKGKDKVTGKDVDNYKSGAVTLNPEPVKESIFSESQKKMIEMYDTKKKKDELEKKDKVSSMMTKDSVKKEDEKEEEQPDMRSKYAMINLIKNKLRAAGQRDPMVMAVDTCEENMSGKEKAQAMAKERIAGKKRQEGEEAAETERTPAEGDPSFSQEYKDNAKKAIEASKNKNKNEVKPYNPYG